MNTVIVNKKWLEKKKNKSAVRKTETRKISVRIDDKTTIYVDNEKEVEKYRKIYSEHLYRHRP